MGSLKPARLPTTTRELSQPTPHSHQHIEKHKCFRTKEKCSNSGSSGNLLSSSDVAAINRITVSQACKDLQKYCTDHGNEDFLIKGFASQKQNPFREKSSCALL